MESITELKSKYRDLTKQYFSSDDLSEKEKIAIEKESLLFVMTWQDTIANLKFVLKSMSKYTYHPPTIIEKEIVKGYPKGRKEVYISTSDNVYFKECFYSTLRQLKNPT